jgi:hypothetical protein
MGMSLPPPKTPEELSIWQRIQGGLLGQPQNYGGLLDPSAQQAAQRQGMLSMGASLLGNSGWSPNKTTFGQALGPALMAGQQGQQQSIGDSLNAALLQSQIQKNKRTTTGKESDAIKQYEYAKAGGYTGSFEDWKRVGSAQPQDPAAIKEYDFYQKLTPAQQAAFIDLKRNSQPYQVVDVGGGKQLLNKSQGNLQSLTTPEQEAAGAGQVAGATKGAQVAAETATTAKFDLPRVETNATYAVDLLDKIKKHPGLDYGVGLWSKAPVVPGTAQADFVALTEQMQGRQFLEAYNSLKGGGQISEIEGTKAENAIARMQRSQSKQAFIDAATEFQGIIKTGLENARKKAGGSPGSAKPRVRVDAQGNVIGN